MEEKIINLCKAAKVSGLDVKSITISQKAMKEFQQAYPENYVMHASEKGLMCMGIFIKSE